MNRAYSSLRAGGEAIQGLITNHSVHFYNSGLPRRKLLAETTEDVLGQLGSLTAVP